MANGIVAKIWNIKEGSLGRSGGMQITDSIAYITNEEKCDERLADGSLAQIGRELTYVTNDVKTLKGVYIGCKTISDIRNATEEMMQVKMFYGKTGGRVALHGILSLDENESDKKNAGKLMMLISDLLDEIFPEHQAVYAIHTNTENLHVHFIVNTVGLSGRKIHMDKNFMSGVFEPAVNRLAETYGFSPNEEWKRQKEKDLTPFAKRAVRLRQAIDEAIERSEDFEGFLLELKSQGIRVNTGKYLSLKEEGMAKAVRSNRLGSFYCFDKIRTRILKKREELIRESVSEHRIDTYCSAKAYFVADPLKRYRDMTQSEKEAAVKMLREGRNPWQERRRTNWQIDRLKDEFQRTSNVYEMIKAFAPGDGSSQQALDTIIALQKDLSKEKKQVRCRLKEYQPIIKLYEQAREYETKAYLYEFAGRTEYESDYEAYKQICQRLRDGYSKSIEEVAEYLQDAKDQLLYAARQQKELSDIYRTIKRFKEEELMHSPALYTSLFDAVGLSKARNQAQLYNVFESSIRYIAADGADSGFIRAVILPEEIGGKKTQRADITVFDAGGNEVSGFSSRDMSVKEFNRKLSELKASMGLYRCHSFETKEEAAAYAGNQKESKRSWNSYPKRQKNR
ncbi:MAG: relaxase/mobilization nuclease domain-containing protein [Lachnospiraceae bacterium]|nr:relaxase/mobilization nuclease domain-containing protein [Lachnospiraceae bacterium]